MSDRGTERSEDPLELRDRLVAQAAEQFRRSDAEAGLALLRQLEFATIDATTLERTDRFFRPWIVRGRRVVATTDPHRTPSPSEIVVIYGNYPHIFDNILVNNPAKRHVASFWNLQHDQVEYNHNWEKLEQIYVINSNIRVDRWDAILRELAGAGAPLDRITRIGSAPGNPEREPSQLNGSIGCLRSHLSALRDARRRRFAHILVLEDDFCFTSDRETHLRDLALFFERRYAYWVCLLATAKYGRIVAKDDLVSLSFQRCTNAAAYLVSREGLDQLIPVQETALERLHETGDLERYATDRCWSALQAAGKFLVFRRKFGFQAAGFSDIERSITRYLD